MFVELFFGFWLESLFSDFWKHIISMFNQCSPIHTCSFHFHKRIETGRAPTVKTAAHLMRRLCYENKDNLMAGVIVGGWDPVEKGSVYNIPLGGTCIKMPFAIGGSGSTYIYGLIDSLYKEGMGEEETLAMVKKSISHAMARDGSSGGVIRTVVVKESGNTMEYIPGNALPFGP